MNILKINRNISLSGLMTLTLVNLIISFEIASVAYVNSSFLSIHFTPEGVSLVYVIGSIISIGVLLIAPSIVKRFGVWSSLVVALPLLQFFLFLFGTTVTAITAAIFFVIRSSLQRFVSYTLDLFVESTTTDEGSTGNVRGRFLTGATIGWLLGPIAASLLIIDSNYQPLYAFAVMLLAPVFLIAITELRKVPPTPPKTGFLLRSIRELYSCRHSIRSTMLVHLVYQTWGVAMIIYSPLFLTESGYTWQTIGSLIAIAILPYLFLELPLGFFADRLIGEKEMMIGGILIVAISSILLSLAPVSNIILWGAFFLIARVGAVMMEVSTETYFFKKVTEEDAALISLFRTLLPLAGIVAPIIGLIFIPFVSLTWIFAVIGVFVLAALPLTFSIHDTR